MNPPTLSDVNAAEAKGDGKKTNSRFPWTFCRTAVWNIRRLLKSQKLLSCRKSLQLIATNPNSVINPSSATLTEASPALCENFLNYFIDKISALRATNLSAANQNLNSECSTVFQQFEPVTLLTLKEIINSLKSSNSCHNILPSRIIKDALNIIGPVSYS